MEIKDYEITKWAVEEAQKAGADAVRAELICFENLNIQAEGNIISSLQQNQSHGLSLSLFVDNRYGSFSTNNFSKESIRNLIHSGIANTRFLAPDPDRTLPDPARYYRASSLNKAIEEALSLKNYNDSPYANAPKPTEIAIDLVKRIEGADPRIINISANVGGRNGWQFTTDSQGFEGFAFGSQYMAYTSVSLQDTDGSRPSDGWVDFALDFNELNGCLDRHSRLALTAAQQKLGAHELKSGKYTIAVEPTCIMKLIDPIVEAMYGGSLYQHQSFLEGKLGEQIASPLLTLREDPQRIGAFGAALFCDDGVAAQPYDLIRNGKLCTWLIGTYYAHKLHMEPTCTNTSVLCIDTQERSRKQILESEPEVLLITGFLGGNSNSTTGDFSFGIEGQLFRYGERVQGVSGMNLTGNFLDFWKHLSETSSDTEKIPDGYFPLTLFKDVTLNN